MFTNQVSPNGLLGKVQLLVSASLHDLVDKALQAKSVEVLSEQIRRLGESRDQIDEMLANVQTDLRIERDKNAGLIEEINTKKVRAKVLKDHGQLDTAAVLVKQFMTKEASLKKSDLSIKDMLAELNTLEQAGLMIDTKKDELVDVKSDVERALKIADTKRTTVKTINDVARLLEADSGPNIGEWAEHQKIVADVRLEQTMAKHGHLLNAADDPEVAAVLAAL